jgi:hypothetical protein
MKVLYNFNMKRVKPKPTENIYQDVIKFDDKKIFKDTTKIKKYASKALQRKQAKSNKKAKYPIGRRRIRLTTIGEMLPVNQTKDRVYSDIEVAMVFKKNFGLVMETCKELGISKQAFFDWRKSYPEFAALLEDSKSEMHDKIEKKLMEQVEKGNTQILMFMAKNLLKERGYTEVEQQSNTQVNIIMPEDMNNKYEWWGNKNKDNTTETTSETVGSVLESEEI